MGQRSSRQNEGCPAVRLQTIPLLLVLLAAPPAFAGIEDTVVAQLRAQGYSEITVGRTWLGRIVIGAARDGMQREVVLNRRTGEILGDHVSALDPDDRFSRSVADSRDGGDSNAAAPPAAAASAGGDTPASAVVAGSEAGIIDSGSIVQPAGTTDGVVD
jgi:hypothetical protein